MRKLNLKFARDLWDAEAPLVAAQPHPFPGEFPTRVGFIAIDRNRRHVPYVGKPSNVAVRMLHMSPYIPWYIEFDQRNLVHSNRFVNPKLWAYYHPGYNPALVSNWWGKVVADRKTLRIGGKRIYRPKAFYLETIKELLRNEGWGPLLGLEAKE